MTRVFEVRIQGQLGRVMLRMLGWSHVTVPEQTLVRVEATPADLQRILRDCTETGLTIERVHRITTASGPAPTDC